MHFRAGGGGVDPILLRYSVKLAPDVQYGWRSLMLVCFFSCYGDESIHYSEIWDIVGPLGCCCSFLIVSVHDGKVNHVHREATPDIFQRRRVEGGTSSRG